MFKLLVIIGATGKQGGSVINSILADSSLKSTFKLRGVTRDPTKANAKALTERGVEMVAGDLDDRASLDAALKGAYGVFAVTDFWASMSMETEVQQGKNIADAAKAAGVQHFVLSSLTSPKKITNGDLSLIDHFEGKADISKYATSLGLPCTFYLPGFYMTNLPNQMLRQDPNTKAWTLMLPVPSDAQIPLIDIEADTGKYVKAIFTNRDKLLGKEVYGAERYYTPQEVIDTFKLTFPKTVAEANFITVPKEGYTEALKGAGMSEKIAKEMTENMLLLKKEYGYYGGADIKPSNDMLDTPASTLAQWLKTVPEYKDFE